VKRGAFACVREDGQPKHKYKSREIAEVHAKQIEKNVLHVVQVYECPHGHGWHIGSRRDTLNERVLRCSPVFQGSR
jgi:hypothetical protein